MDKASHRFLRAAAAAVVGGLGIADTVSRAVVITPVGNVVFPAVPSSTASEFSGMTYLGGNSYYAISDNDNLLYPLTIGLNSSTGALTSMNIGTGIPMTL